MSKKQVQETVAKEATRKPEKVLRIEDVSASVFARGSVSRGETRTFYSVSFSRSYKDASGTWRYAKSFDLEDLGKIVTLCQQADAYIREQLAEAA